jgi:CMP-N,N'-diacetyllegionaminic acid synthase
MKEDILTIIPARGGSQAVPKKNIKELAGKPLIAWIIEAVKEAGNAGRVIVSTDSEEIADVARKYGIEVPFLRPEEISQALSTDLEFVFHALDHFEKEEGWIPKAVARFSPVTPFVPSSVIAESINLLLKSPEIHSVRPISRLSHHPYKAWKIEGEFMVPAFSKEVTGFDEPYNLPRQLFPEMYAHLGAAGVAWTKTFRELNSTSGSIMKYVLMDEIDAFDINHPSDFEIAEVLMAKRKK